MDKVGIDDDDVVSMNATLSMIDAQIFKFSELVRGLSNRLDSGFQQNPWLWRNWIDEGIQCELLRASTGGWRKGKIRIHIRFEFIPDEPELPNDQEDKNE